MRPRFRAATAAATAAVLFGTGLGLATPAVADHTTSGVFISEIHYDNDGTDIGEAIEMQAPVGTDLTGWDLVLYNGSGGAVYDTDPVGGVVGDSGVLVVNYPSNGIQNGSPDGMALVDASDAVVEFLSYEGTFTAVGGPADGMLSVDIGVQEGSTTPVGHSLQRDPVDHDVWTGPAPNSFGAINGGDPLPPPDPVSCETTVTHTIPEVQGDGESTPLAGQTVTVNGVVTADLQDGGYNGFHLQDPGGDGNPATSDGIFIFDEDAPDVAVGDSVVVSGTAGEFFELTQIAATGVVVCPDLGFQVPPAVPLDLPLDEAGFEALEGMFVQPVDTLTVSEVFNLNRFGELVLSEGGRLLQPTEVFEPGPEADALAAENRTRRVLLDDGRSFNLASASPPVAPPYLTLEDPVRVGDTVSFLEPVVLSFGFGEYRLQPVDGLGDSSTFAPTNPRPETPEPVGGDVQLGAFNVLNYFTTLTSENDEARGADTPEEFARQEAKIVEAISLLGADVVALQEIENSVALGEPVDEALSALVAALNADSGTEIWGFVPSPTNLPPADQQDVITNAIIYRLDTVERVGESVARTNEEVWFNAREPIAQTFALIGNTDTFTVVSNHFKSKSSRGATGDNVDMGDGQGAYNGDRTRQAADLALFVDELVASTGDPDVILLGDFNAYTMEDPIDVLRDAGLVDLGSQFAPGDYSYVFAGQTGSLDHAIATASVTAKVTDVDIWNINAVESFAYQYNGFEPLYDDDQFRASDHDPILVGLDVDDEPPSLLERLRDLIRRLIGLLPGRG
ncbi:hypothetical protein BH20ACT5_BH20ACT5_02230 [soil metagenome]